MENRHVLAVALAALVAVGCADDRPVTSPPSADDAATVGSEVAGDVTASLSAAPADEGRRDVTLVLTGEEGAPGAYQGRLEFASDLELVDVERADEGFHVVNREEAEEGRLQFAGYAVEGLPPSGVLTLTFAADRDLQDDDFRLQLDVVGTRTGQEVPGDRVRITRGLERTEGGELRSDGER